MINQALWGKITFWVTRPLLQRAELVFEYGELSKFLRAKLEEEIARREEKKLC